MKTIKTKPTYFYACATELLFESDVFSLTLYPSIEMVKERKPCTEECGIIKVKVESCGYATQPTRTR